MEPGGQVVRRRLIDDYGGHMTEVDYTAARFWWDVAQSLAVVGLFIWTLLDRKRQRNSEDIQALGSRAEQLDRRVQRLEDTQAMLPTHHDLTAVRNQVAGLHEKIEAQSHLLQTIHQFLLTERGEQ